MRNQRGITLTSLVVYIALMIVVIILLARISAFFTKNMEETNKYTAMLAEIDKFNTFFIKDVKESGNSIREVLTNKVVFSNGNIYEFSEEDETVYYQNNSKKIALSEGIEECTFSSREENEKTIITVDFDIADVSKQYEYVMHYENTYKDYREGYGKIKE